MATIEKQRERLITLLGDLFQLNQPDLDFGFYRIMHAKADRVSSFLQNDLLKIIKDAFGEADEKRVIEARLAYEAAIKQAKEFGAPNPEDTEPVKKAKAAYDALRDTGNGEGEIYDHLFRFFERYYDNGDFMSRRYYARETDGKAAPYSIPYDGREVYLHWANRDQYYIKTSEYLTNFTFDVAKFFIKEQRVTLGLPEILKLHCRIVEAAEGEHGNVKATDKTERYFLIHKNEPVTMEGGDLVLQFEYRPDAEKSGQGGKWQEKRLDEAEALILQNLPSGPHWKAALNTKIGEQQDRILLRRYLNQYTSRNTMDYFIHKDLGGFMRRELDFYIKNEIMRLDDIESADVPRVDFYLSKIKVLRKIAHHLIDFMAQLEDFQKKLWLKKKFVVETNYCITLDRIPENLYPEIAANDAQREEWVKLFAIEDLKGYKKPLSTAFLKDNPFLVLDTAFFDEAFKARVLAGIQGLDEQSGGVLIHSENFQALRTLTERYQQQVKCTYIDPPYNTGKDGFIYKDTYRSSCWNSAIDGGLKALNPLLSNDSLLFISNDDNENENLKKILRQNSYLVKSNLIWNTDGHTDNQFEIKVNHEYVTLSQKTQNADYGNVIDPNTREESNLWKNIAENSITKNGEANPFSEITLPIGFPVAAEEGIIESCMPAEGFFNELGKQTYYPRGLIKKHNVSFPIKYNSASYKKFKLTQELKVSAGWANLNKLKKFISSECKPFEDDGGMMEFYLSAQGTIYYKKIKNSARNIVSVLRNFTTTEKMKYELEDMDLHFSYPKPKDLIAYLLKIGNAPMYLDYFAGSGTTAHAVIEMNRDDAGSRKYTMVEMGEYFNTVIIPRLKKVVYSKDWKEGKPLSRDGISHCFKYIRLESYEDALNNLVFRDDDVREQALKKHDDFRREYMLKYWLDFETKGSPSLLSVEQFSDPTVYKLKIKKPGSDEYALKAVDLMETFNWLIGLHVDHIDAPRTFGGTFKREADPELPNDQATRLILDGKLTEDTNGKWWFRKVEGRVCRTPGDKTNMDKVLVIWRKLTGNLEEDNLMLDEWFSKYRLSTQDTEFDVIYVNGSNNLPNLKRDDEHWKVRLIEETFHQKMWDVEG
jgi:adenine-specific DNA-methyltransferase